MPTPDRETPRGHDLLPGIAEEMERSAFVDGSRLQYRYWLRRRWGPGATCNFVLLNPSTADASLDDPTVRKCVGFARRWGFGTLSITNLFAFRATDPGDMKRAADPVGPHNEAHLLGEATAAALVVAGWGAHGGYRGRDAEVRRLLSRNGVRLHCLHLTRDRQPGHPLYLAYGSTPILMEPSRA